MRDSLPLLNKRILITRSKEQAADFSHLVEELGGTALVVPLIQFSLPVNSDEISSEIHECIEEMDNVVFTSTNGVDYFFQLYNKPIHKRIAAVGEKTKEALEKRGLEVSVMPNKFTAEHLLDSIIVGTEKSASILLIQGNLARPILREQLMKLGYNVKQIVVYENTMPTESIHKLKKLSNEKFDIVTFTSPSSVRNFSNIIPPEKLNADVAVIGPITESAAKQLGYTVQISPENYTVQSLVDSIVHFYNKK
ncbi:MAG: uroporphyrinogen-III synthase [Bacillaceae bacterium]|nr:uroporphyrinogen-III synthase [Bacillaceae bacterium]